MITVLKRLHQLQGSALDISRDKPELMQLYDAVYEIANDKSNFACRSSSMIEALKNGELSDREEKNWLSYVSEIYAAYAAVKMYEESQQGTLEIASEELEWVRSFYQCGNYSREVTAIGLYVCAQQMNENDPMQSYELMKDAFMVYPDLANLLGVKYCYEGKAAEEELTKECPWCGAQGEDIVPYYCAPQVMQLENNQSFPPAKLWMKCESCGNLFVYNFPKSSIGLINGHYTQKGRDDKLENKFSLDHYNSIFNQFRKMTPGTEYLEIGTGTGEMLAVALEFGYHVKAIEICREDCERISSFFKGEVEIQWCDISDYEADRQYDVIVMGDVLEHVIEPVRVLKKIKQMLKENGVLWISTPNYNSAYARMEKFSHCMWHALNHYTYVCFESLSKLLQDMEMQIIHYDMSTRYIGSMEIFVKHQVDRND